MIPLAHRSGGNGKQKLLRRLIGSFCGSFCEDSIRKTKLCNETGSPAQREERREEENLFKSHRGVRIRKTLGYEKKDERKMT